jgi:hypothetical protein
LFEQTRWSKWAWLGLGAGYLWLSAADSLGGVASLPVWILGAAFVAVGFSQLFWPGDRRIGEIGALAGLLGLIVSFLYGPALGWVGFIALFGAALASAWSAGRMAIELEPHLEGVPAPEPTLSLAAKVAVDELILGFENFSSASFALDGTLERVIGEIREMHSRFDRDGLLEKPETYHRAPPELIDPEIRPTDIRGHRVEVLRFESGYAPAEGEPGQARWMGYAPCRDGWAYVLRHPGPPRPWLICTNGYRMGFATVDVALFGRFFDLNGLNVLIPVLPLHGSRRLGWNSGSGFLGIDVIDTLHAEAQAIWDMRRLLSWVRAQEAPSVGAFGLSLGGYTTALFASVAEELACVIAGIPLTDIPRACRRHGAPHQMRYAESLGYDAEQIDEIMRVVSPLVLEPKVAQSSRLIFGANADRIVPPDQVLDLWRHWQEPEIVWYAGSHISFLRERGVWSAVDRTLRDAGVVAELG